MAYGYPDHQCGRDNPDEFGCLSNAKIPRWGLICPNCLGDGQVNFDICPECKGNKTITQLRCPESVCDSEEDRGLFAISLQAKSGMWPSAGGYLDQPCFVVDAVKIISFIEREIDHRKRPKA